MPPPSIYQTVFRATGPTPTFFASTPSVASLVSFQIHPKSTPSAQSIQFDGQYLLTKPRLETIDEEEKQKLNHRVLPVVDVQSSQVMNPTSHSMFPSDIGLKEVNDLKDHETHDMIDEVSSNSQPHQSSSPPPNPLYTLKDIITHDLEIQGKMTSQFMDYAKDQSQPFVFSCFSFHIPGDPSPAYSNAVDLFRVFLGFIYLGQKKERTDNGLSNDTKLWVEDITFSQTTPSLPFFLSPAYIRVVALLSAQLILSAAGIPHATLAEMLTLLSVNPTDYLVVVNHIFSLIPLDLIPPAFFSTVNALSEIVVESHLCHNPKVALPQRPTKRPSAQIVSPPQTGTSLPNTRQSASFFDGSEMDRLFEWIDFDKSDSTATPHREQSNRRKDVNECLCLLDAEEADQRLEKEKLLNNTAPLLLTDTTGKHITEPAPNTSEEVVMNWMNSLSATEQTPNPAAADSGSLTSNNLSSRYDTLAAQITSFLRTHQHSSAPPNPQRKRVVQFVDKKEGESSVATVQDTSTEPSSAAAPLEQPQEFSINNPDTPEMRQPEASSEDLLHTPKNSQKRLKMEMTPKGRDFESGGDRKTRVRMENDLSTVRHLMESNTVPKSRPEWKAEESMYGLITPPSSPHDDPLMRGPAPNKTFGYGAASPEQMMAQEKNRALDDIQSKLDVLIATRRYTPDGQVARLRTHLQASRRGQGSPAVLSRAFSGEIHDESNITEEQQMMDLVLKWIRLKSPTDAQRAIAEELLLCVEDERTKQKVDWISGKTMERKTTTPRVLQTTAEKNAHEQYNRATAKKEEKDNEEKVLFDQIRLMLTNPLQTALVQHEQEFSSDGLVYHSNNLSTVVSPILTELRHKRNRRLNSHLQPNKRWATNVHSFSKNIIARTFSTRSISVGMSMGLSVVALSEMWTLFLQSLRWSVLFRDDVDIRIEDVFVGCLCIIQLLVERHQLDQIIRDPMDKHSILFPSQPNENDSIFMSSLLSGPSSHTPPLSTEPTHRPLIDRVCEEYERTLGHSWQKLTQNQQHRNHRERAERVLSFVNTVLVEELSDVITEIEHRLVECANSEYHSTAQAEPARGSRPLAQNSLPLSQTRETRRTHRPPSIFQPDDGFAEKPHPIPTQTTLPTSLEHIDASTIKKTPRFESDSESLAETHRMKPLLPQQESKSTDIQVVEAAQLLQLKKLEELRQLTTPVSPTIKTEEDQQIKVESLASQLPIVAVAEQEPEKLGQMIEHEPEIEVVKETEIPGDSQKPSSEPTSSQVDENDASDSKEDQPTPPMDDEEKTETGSSSGSDIFPTSDESNTDSPQIEHPEADFPNLDEAPTTPKRRRVSSSRPARYSPQVFQSRTNRGRARGRKTHRGGRRGTVNQTRSEPVVEKLRPTLTVESSPDENDVEKWKTKRDNVDSGEDEEDSDEEDGKEMRVEEGFSGLQSFLNREMALFEKSDSSNNDSLSDLDQQAQAEQAHRTAQSRPPSQRRHFGRGKASQFTGHGKGKAGNPTRVATVFASKPKARETLGKGMVSTKAVFDGTKGSINKTRGDDDKEQAHRMSDPPEKERMKPKRMWRDVLLGAFETECVSVCEIIGRAKPASFGLSAMLIKTILPTLVDNLKQSDAATKNGDALLSLTKQDEPKKGKEQDPYKLNLTPLVMLKRAKDEDRKWRQEVMIPLLDAPTRSALSQLIRNEWQRSFRMGRGFLQPLPGETELLSETQLISNINTERRTMILSLHEPSVLSNPVLFVLYCLSSFNTRSQEFIHPVPPPVLTSFPSLIKLHPTPSQHFSAPLIRHPPHSSKSIPNTSPLPPSYCPTPPHLNSVLVSQSALWNALVDVGTLRVKDDLLTFVSGFIDSHFFRNTSMTLSSQLKQIMKNEKQVKDENNQPTVDQSSTAGMMLDRTIFTQSHTASPQPVPSLTPTQTVSPSPQPAAGGQIPYPQTSQNRSGGFYSFYSSMTTQPTVAFLRSPHRPQSSMGLRTTTSPYQINPIFGPHPASPSSFNPQQNRQP
ncbi:hypothetical protein BLNAU_13221 [Blattamonas nauphoetae]|uniref:Uncharacterized protein n=1 Tax=Blattamonas nauphoetae TaxID=2049346 RepID=A0ABQ9XNM5_9EUKA|nr:hypothetical protein BLNAU_13221 [Blattamonas nauphoetae]